MQNQKWTRERTVFTNRNLSSTYRLDALNVTVTRASNLDQGDGWLFQYHGTVTETHTGFRTMAAARAAAIAYATSPIGEAHAAAAAFRG